MPGPTGKYPRGPIRKQDDGELEIAVRKDPDTRTVVVEFGKSVSWIGFDTATARGLAQTLLKVADEIDTRGS
jgi:hypothetical protein